MERTSLQGVVVCALDAQNPKEVLSFPGFSIACAETREKAPVLNRTTSEALKRETTERKPFNFPRLISQTVPELQRRMQLEGKGNQEVISGCVSGTASRTGEFAVTLLGRLP